MTSPYEAAEEAVGRISEAEGIGDDLVDLAMIRSDAGGRENANFALYYLVYAANLGVSDSQKITVVRVLARLRQLDEALEIARSIHADQLPCTTSRRTRKR